MSCGSIPVYDAPITEDRVKIPLSLFVGNEVHIIRPAGFPYNIALQRKSDGTFLALLLRCTHADNQVNYGGNGYVCNLHGSRYDAAGEVTRGPATRPLRKLMAEVRDLSVLLSLA